MFDLGGARNSSNAGTPSAWGKRTSTRVFYMRACGPRSSEVGPSNRRLLTACLASLAVAVGVPVAAAAKGDHAVAAPVAVPAKRDKSVKDGSAKLTRALTRKVTGAGKLAGAGVPGKSAGGAKAGNGKGANKPVTGA